MMDESEKFDITQFYIYDTFLYALMKNGRVVEFRDDVYSDEDYVFPIRIESKRFDFGEPYHPKKLKELQIMMDKLEEDDSIQVYVYADNTRIWNVSEEDTTSDREMWDIGKSYYANDDSQVYKLRLAGKCRQVKVVFTQEKSNSFKLFGFGFKFKTKAP